MINVCLIDCRDSALYYYRARTYDPKVGRFLQTDPIPPRPREMNAYVYVANNPVNRVDPRGRNIWVEGPSGTEPPGHLSICVGKPGGHYLSVSFGLNLGNPFAWDNGRVYVDDQHGGEVVRMLDTTLQEDLYALQILTEMLADPNGHYNIWDGTRRDFSNAMFDHFEDVLGLGEKK